VNYPDLETQRAAKEALHLVRRKNTGTGPGPRAGVRNGVKNWTEKRLLKYYTYVNDKNRQILEDVIRRAERYAKARADD